MSGALDNKETAIYKMVWKYKKENIYDRSKYCADGTPSDDTNWFNMCG